jgi:hypothetical protein
MDDHRSPRARRFSIQRAQHFVRIDAGIAVRRCEEDLVAEHVVGHLAELAE